MSDDVHDTLRDFAVSHDISQVQLVAALIRRLHLRKIDVAEAVAEARSMDTGNRDHRRRP